MFNKHQIYVKVCVKKFKKGLKQRFFENQKKIEIVHNFCDFALFEKPLKTTSFSQNWKMQTSSPPQSRSEKEFFIFAKNKTAQTISQMAVLNFAIFGRVPNQPPNRVFAFLRRLFTTTSYADS